MGEFVFNGAAVHDSSDCLVIAEMGHNHQGNVETAKDMIRSAKECGADAVKLQKRDNRSLYTRDLYDSVYSNDNSYGATYGSHREALEFDREQYLDLMQYARELEIPLFATAFDFKSVDFLVDLDMPAFKIASGDLTNTPLLEYVAQTGKPMVVSTGGGSLDDVRRAYDTIMPVNTNLCLLQCTAAYPIFDYRDMNLNVITTYRETFPDVIVGLSDHESGIAMALVAYMLGARVVEKHFTLNRAWKGTDHSFSLAPGGLRRLTRNLHRARLALGDGVKKRLPCEEKPLLKMGKKLVAARDLPAGTVMDREYVAIKSPGDGVAPYELDSFLGRRLKRDLKCDENLILDDVE